MQKIPIDIKMPLKMDRSIEPFICSLGLNIKYPAKYFSIGRVFRNEAIDQTHLAEFHQVEGFVMDEGLTLRDLMGYIKEFYSKMGIHKINHYHCNISLLQ